MMDQALAAPSLSLDSKVQAKTGSRAKEADGEGKKAAFEHALSKHANAKGQNRRLEGQADGGEPARMPGDTDLPGLDTGDTPDNSDNTLAQAPDVPGAVRLKKPLHLLVAKVEQRAPDAAQQPEQGAVTDKRIDIRHVRADKTAIAETADQTETDTEGADTFLPEVALKLEGDEKPAKPVADAAALRRELGDGAESVRAPDIAAHHALVMLDQSGARPKDVDHGSDGHGTMAVSSDDDAVARPAANESASYRISRADGKGGVIEMPGQHALSEARDQAAPASSFNQVTVLDQRRYLAPAQDNSLAVVNSLSKNPDWATAMQADSALANAATVAGGGKVVNTLKIQMNPIDLGMVTATLKLRGEELSVELKVETSAAFRQLKDDHNRIMDALKAQGFSVDQVTVVMAPERPDTGNAGNGNQQNNGQGPGFAQQQGRDGGQGAATGRDRRNFDHERAGNGSGSADDSRVESAGLGNAGPRSTGGVYL